MVNKNFQRFYKH